MDDSLPSLTSMVSHRLELYTGQMIIQGQVNAPFKRTTDLMNWDQAEFLSVQGATVTPLGQAPAQKPPTSAIMVSRSHVHFAAEMPPPQTGKTPAELSTGFLLGQSDYVRKANFPCCAITETYAVYGNCYLHTEGTLENMIQASRDFIPLTRATVYKLGTNANPLQRDLVIVNRRMLAAIYLI
jgi:hypothetical protein